MKLEPWERNLYAIWLAQFIALAGGNLIFPFVPLYVQDLGVHSHVAFWAGLVATAGGVTMFIFSPIWGGLADRYGRKPMLLRAYVGATIVITLQGLAQNVWQLLALRAAQGAFVGTIPAANALIASGTPRSRVPYAMGLFQMGIYSSQTIGPVVGGAVADAVGFRPTFVITGVFYALAFLLVSFAVREEFVPPPARERPRLSQNIRDVMGERMLLFMVGVTFFLYGAPVFVRPIVPLLVETFDGRGSAARESGFVFSAFALTSAVTAIGVARLSRRLGARRTLVLAIVGSGIAYLPVARAGSAWSLLLLMAGVGIFSGGSIPTANALISALSPAGRQGSAFGLVGSAQALALAVGPLLGGVAASFLGIHSGFVIVGGVLLVLGVVVLAVVREPAAAEEREPIEVPTT